MAGPIRSQTDTRRVAESLNVDLSELVQSHTRLWGQVEQANGLHLNLIRKAEQVIKAVEAAQKAHAAAVGPQLIAMVRDMQRMMLSHNLQYLQLQSKMQNESRQFTLISNIMKTKHDTVKNSISNIR